MHHTVTTEWNTCHEDPLEEYDTVNTFGRNARMLFVCYSLEINVFFSMGYEKIGLSEL